MAPDRLTAGPYRENDMRMPVALNTETVNSWSRPHAPLCAKRRGVLVEIHAAPIDPPPRRGAFPNGNGRHSVTAHPSPQAYQCTARTRPARHDVQTLESPRVEWDRPATWRA